jgi:hypothetical protein
MTVWLLATAVLAVAAVAVARLGVTLAQGVLRDDFWAGPVDPLRATMTAAGETGDSLADLGRRADALRDRVHDVTGSDDPAWSPGSTGDRR